MKKTYLISFFLLFNINLSKAQDIEESINEAFYTSFQIKNINQMEKILNDLNDSDPRNKNIYLIYWKAYTLYRESISTDYLGNTDLSKKKLDEAKDILNNAPTKTSENYALLAHCINFSISYANFMQKPLLSLKAKKMANKALELDSNNIRAHLALAIKDFYTPKQYGGMKNCLNILLKILNTPNKTSNNPNDPSWGRDEAYYYIVRFYIINKNIKEANRYLEEGLKEFPHDNRLKSIKIPANS